MAIINCPECGKEISDTASRCVHCGYSLKKVKKERKKISKKAIIISIIVLFLIVSLGLLTYFIIIPEVKINKEYKTAEKLLQEQEYDEAIDKFISLDGYKDSEERIKECYYEKGLDLYSRNRRDSAIEAFEEAGDYEDASDQITMIKDEIKAEEEEKKRKEEEETKKTFEQIVEKVNEGTEYINEGNEIVNKLDEVKYIDDAYSVVCDVYDCQIYAKVKYQEAVDLCGSNKAFSELKTQLKYMTEIPDKPYYADSSLIEYWLYDQAEYVITCYNMNLELKNVKSKLNSDVSITEYK